MIKVRSIDTGNADGRHPRLPTAQPEQITPLYWELHTTDRDEAERVNGL
ncbi:hypothetical protein FRACA_20003 [Frankia canadensis]|uniref:Uncharacterized protein n=1 Tax=Frankia canadensis TaxID=1836972 RepID=A0A2I2KPK9_9ACTN|nr:hypothetical protein [Frankia canadensis]SNQ47607.1 hypothetical protein FRACA_20003 [Frankia canadensis]SOU54897.1 hypothetical protein FRACA_20003 [Frankia canadensis]